MSLFLGLLFSALALLSSMWWAVPCFLFLSAAVVCLLRSEPEEAIAPRIVRTRRSTTAAVAAPGELTVRDVMLVNPIAMPANAPVAAAARAMRDLDVGAVVVVEDERPLGVMTDRDTVVGIVSLDDLVGTADRSEG